MQDMFWSALAFTMGVSQLRLKMGLAQIEVFLLFKKLPRCVPMNWNNLMIRLDICSTFGGTHPFTIDNNEA